MTCILVALVITCSGSSVRLTPAEAAAILAPHQYVHVPRSAGPHVTVIAGDPTDGPFGPLVLTQPTTRLDGTPLDSPQWMAMAYPSYPFAFVGQRRGSGRGRRTR